MTFAEFADLVAEVADLDTSHLDPDVPLADAGIDSLGLVLVLLHVEERGVPLPEDLVQSWTTVGDLFHQVARWLASDEPRARPPGGLTVAAPRDPVAVLEVEGRHVHLTPLLPEHVPLLHRIAATTRNSVSWWPRGRTISIGEFEDRLWADAVLLLVVVDRVRGAILGLVRIADYHERDGHAQLSVLGLPDARTWLMEGVILALHRAFAMWPLRKLYLLVSELNEPLIRPRRELFALEGTLRGHEYFDGAHRDLHVYALYRDTFEQRWLTVVGPT